MIKFKQKEYTIQEGHYTGTKDMESLPGTVSTIAKGAGIGTVIGAIGGNLIPDSSTFDGAISGFKYGTLSGIAAKILLNYVHKPMTSMKYQEVDKGIRKQFGMFRAAGITVGDSLDKRASLDEKYSFNDRDVAKYKINCAIHNNEFTLYIFGVTKEELDTISNSLDYYCKKYFAMEYTARIINQKVNSYAVDIIFTNYHVIVEFISELSTKLGTKINLLDNNAIVLPRLSEEAEKNFSIIDSFNKNDKMKILLEAAGSAIAHIMTSGSLKDGISSAIQNAILSASKKLINKEVVKNGGSVKRGEYDNTVLETTLKKLFYKEGNNYTKGEKTSNLNISVTSGILIITATKDNAEKIDEGLWKSLKLKIQRKSIQNKVVIYTYSINDLREFEMIIRKLMACGVKPNIYEG